MPNDPRESSFMMAAQDQLNQIFAENAAITAAYNGMVKSNRRQKIYTYITAAVVILMAVLFWQQHQQVIGNCEAGNDFRAGQTQNWATFIGIATQGSNDPATLAKGAQLLKAVEATDAPRACPATWDVFGGFR